MIQCEKRPNGGRLRVVARGNENVLDFTLSNSGSPLTLSVTEQYGNEPTITVAMVDGLVQRYSPPVVWFTSGNAELRYSPCFANDVYRHSTVHETSLYTRPFSDGKAFSRIYALAEAMCQYALVRSVNEQLQIFDRHAILSKFRKAMKPIEFLTIKEESDYSIQGACVDATREAISSGKEQLDATKEYRAGFAEVLHELETRQNGSAYSFDAKTAYLREVVAGVCLPAIVLFGSNHPFTQAVSGAFARGAARYAQISEDLLQTYEDALKYSK